MMDLRELKDREAYEAELIRRASRFSVTRPLGRGRYFTEYRPDLPAARELARALYGWGGKRRGVLIYAVTEDGCSALVETYPATQHYETAKQRSKRERATVAA